MRRELVFLVINTILLAVIAASTMLSLRILQNEQTDHRLRNEAEHICELRSLTIPPDERDPAKWIADYEACVATESGRPSPLHKK